MTRETQTPIILERTYPATARELWDLWTTKDGFESWWGPDGFRAEVHTLDAKVGGVLHYDMIAATSEMIDALAEMGRPASHPTRARFTELEPPRRLVITNTIDFLPGVASYETTITVELIELGDTTRMVVILSPLHDAEFSQMQGEGMGSQLGKLDRRYA